MKERGKTSKVESPPRKATLAKNGAHAALREEINGHERNGYEKFTFASLFSGIGGIDLGFENAGFKVNFQCEISKYCLSILEKHWPIVPKWKNIKELNYARIPNSDVWAG